MRLATKAEYDDIIAHIKDPDKLTALKTNFLPGGKWAEIDINSRSIQFDSRIIRSFPYLISACINNKDCAIFFIEKLNANVEISNQHNGITYNPLFCAVSIKTISRSLIDLILAKLAIKNLPVDSITINYLLQRLNSQPKVEHGYEALGKFYAHNEKCAKLTTKTPAPASTAAPVTASLNTPDAKPKAVTATNRLLAQIDAQAEDLNLQIFQVHTSHQIPFEQDRKRKRALSSISESAEEDSPKRLLLSLHAKKEALRQERLKICESTIKQHSNTLNDLMKKARLEIIASNKVLTSVTETLDDIQTIINALNKDINRDYPIEIVYRKFEKLFPSEMPFTLYDFNNQWLKLKTLEAKLAKLVSSLDVKVQEAEKVDHGYPNPSPTSSPRPRRST